jgi:energy-converting hydrogenase Eha subunit G
MIQGNQTWLAALQAGQKQPLYLFEIPDLNLVIASFSPNVVTVTLGGYGVILYGVGGCGT